MNLNNNSAGNKMSLKNFKSLTNSSLEAKVEFLSNKNFTGDDINFSRSLIMLAEICDLSRNYNIRNLTPIEMQELADKLFRTGFINFEMHAILSFAPDFLEEYKTTGKSYQMLCDKPNKKRDYFCLWKIHNLVVKLESKSKFEIQLTQKIVNFLGNFIASK